MVFTDKNFKSICNKLAKKDADLQSIIHQHGYPPLWKRTASFETLVHIILEQQVSLASALAALNKLKQKIVQITPQNLFSLSDEELKACYFSKQKIIYTKHLASEIISGQLNLDELNAMDDDSIRTSLLKIKGIGNWTVDVYLMMVLQRSNLFPLGDIALLKSVREIKGLSKEISTAAIKQMAEKWKPYQTIAVFILWHAYLCKRKQRVL